MSLSHHPPVKTLKSAGLPEKFGTVIHLGAGPYFEEEFYRGLEADRILLIEADPAAAATLREASRDPRIEVLERLVAPQEGMHAFYRYSLPSLNGLLPAGEIKQIYPRLTEVETLSLPACSLESLLKSLNLSKDLPHLLILDVPGVETPLLSSLQAGEGGDETHPEWMMVRGGAGSLMEGGVPIGEAIAILQDRHFTVMHCDKETDPERPLYLLGKDRKLIRLAEAERRIKELEAALKAKDEQMKLAAERDERIVDLERLVADQTEIQNQVFDESEKALSASEIAKEMLTKENEILKKTISEKIMQIAALEAQIGDLESMQGKIETEMSRVQAQLAMLKDLFKGAL